MTENISGNVIFDYFYFVEYGKVWSIKNKEDYLKAIDLLFEAKVDAEIEFNETNDENEYCKEIDEIEKQRNQVMKTASELGFI